jgi:hypothetical protein
MNTPNPENEEIKEVTIAGETYRFAPLSMLQIEEFVDAPEAPLDYKASRDRTWGTIHASLSNAGGPSAPSINDLKTKHSLKGFLALHRAALEVSGLRDPEPVQ